jgi:hypothetical protein
MSANTIDQYEVRRIAEQHANVHPDHIDYLSLRVHSRSEKNFDLVAVLNEEGEQIHKTNQLDVRTTPFDFAKEARTFAKRFYKGITIQRD